MLACVAGVRAGTVEVPTQVGGAYSVPVTSMREERTRATVRQQFDFSCGSAAISTLLTHHYGLPVSEQAVFQAMFDAGDRDKIRVEGFSLLDMKRYLERRGFEADGFEASLDSLASANIPAVVLLNESGYNHFVVVKGLRDGRVLFGDPASGTRSMPRAAFESRWVNQILFVVSNHQASARFNAATDWQAAPRAPIGNLAGGPTGTAAIALPKFGSADF
ncbi:MAG: C39 family peptidase [Tepidisphaeraceae bacterium]